MTGLRVMFVGLLVVFASCQRPAPSQPAIQVRLASWDETQASIAVHKGKVVVLDVWSTWCAPCVAEFPGLVALHREHTGRVVCVSLNCNYTGAASEPPGIDLRQITAFLTQQGATFDNIICTDTDEKLFQALDVAAIPVVLVFDRDGKLRKQFDNDEEEFGPQGFTYDQHIAPLVEKLLAE